MEEEHSRLPKRVRLTIPHWVDTIDDPDSCGFWMDDGEVCEVYDGDHEGSIFCQVDGEAFVATHYEVVEW
jgi:hypothetical protein